MSLFNKLKNRTKRITNRAGGEAFAQTPKMELASMLYTTVQQVRHLRS